MRRRISAFLRLKFLVSKDRTPKASTHNSNAPSTASAYAWGVHNQTAVVPLATLADNAWALKVWRDEAEHQQHHPPAA
jgi:hypothetical protein